MTHLNSEEAMTEVRNIFDELNLCFSDGEIITLTPKQENEYKKAIELAVLRGRREELAHIEPIPEAEEYLRFWWGENNDESDIAMTLTERIAELDKQIQQLTNNV